MNPPQLASKRFVFPLLRRTRRPDELRPLFVLAPPRAASRRCTRGSVLNTGDVLLLATAEERQGGAKLCGDGWTTRPCPGLHPVRVPPGCSMKARAAPVHFREDTPCRPVRHCVADLPLPKRDEAGAPRTEDATVTHLDLVGAVYAIEEEPTPWPEASLGVGRGGAAGFELATQHVRPPRSFVVLTSDGAPAGWKTRCALSDLGQRRPQLPACWP